MLMGDGPRLKSSSSEVHRGTNIHEQVQRSGTRGFPGILLYRVLCPTHSRLTISPPATSSKPTHLTLCSPPPSCPNPSLVLGPHLLPIRQPHLHLRGLSIAQLRLGLFLLVGWRKSLPLARVHIWTALFSYPASSPPSPSVSQASSPCPHPMLPPTPGPSCMHCVPQFLSPLLFPGLPLSFRYLVFLVRK